MSNKSRKNKSSQSPKQEPEQTHEQMTKDSEEAIKAERTKVQHDPNTPFSFETNLPEINKAINEVAIMLQAVADRLNTETIFGITAARFQSFADKIKKYPKQLEKKAAKERRRLTQTETKEEKKEKKSKALREKIQALQTKLAELS